MNGAVRRVSKDLIEWTSESCVLTFEAGGKEVSSDDFLSLEGDVDIAAYEALIEGAVADVNEWLSRSHG